MLEGMDDLDTIVLCAVVFLILSFVWDFLIFSNQLGEADKKQCPPHLWAPNAENKLQCQNPGCEYIAGSDHKPRGDE